MQLSINSKMYKRGLCLLHVLGRSDILPTVVIKCVHFSEEKPSGNSRKQAPAVGFPYADKNSPALLIRINSWNKKGGGGKQIHLHMMSVFVKKKRNKAYNS